MKARQPTDSTALIIRSVNNDVPEYDNNETDPCSDCCDCHDCGQSSNCQTIKYTCMPWDALSTAVSDSAFGADDHQPSKLECCISVTITPFVAPFAALMSIFGCFYGGTRDAISGCKTCCMPDNDPEFESGIHGLKMVQ